MPKGKEHFVRFKNADRNILSDVPTKRQVIDMRDFRPSTHWREALMNDNDAQQMLSATHTAQSHEFEETQPEGLPKAPGSEAQVSVSNFINTLKRNAAEEYIKLLVYFVRYKELTMRQAETATGELRQTNHGRFNRLREADILDREKKRSTEGKLEYHYFLSSRVSKDEIVLEAEKRNVSIADEVKSENHNSEAIAKTIMTDSNLSAAIPFTQEPRPSATELLLEKLPEFNPTWPEEVQAQWLKSYQQLLDMVKK